MIIGSSSSPSEPDGVTATDGGLLGTEGADLGRGAAAGAKAGDVAVGEDETVSDGLRWESDPALTTEVTEAVD